MSHNADNEMQPLSGSALFFGALCLAMANFLAILDTTIANVSVSNIAGSLGTSTSQGTYVITSYGLVGFAIWLYSSLCHLFSVIRCFFITLWFSQ